MVVVGSTDCLRAKLEDVRWLAQCVELDILTTALPGIDGAAQKIARGEWLASSDPERLEIEIDEPRLSVPPVGVHDDQHGCIRLARIGSRRRVGRLRVAQQLWVVGPV